MIDLTKLCMYALLMVMGWGGVCLKKILLHKSFIENLQISGIIIQYMYMQL